MFGSHPSTPGCFHFFWVVLLNLQLFLWGSTYCATACFDTKTGPQGSPRKTPSGWVKGWSGSIYVALDEGLVVKQMSLMRSGCLFNITVVFFSCHDQNQIIFLFLCILLKILVQYWDFLWSFSPALFRWKTWCAFYCVHLHYLICCGSPGDSKSCYKPGKQFNSKK